MNKSISNQIIEIVNNYSETYFNVFCAIWNNINLIFILTSLMIIILVVKKSRYNHRPLPRQTKNGIDDFSKEIR